MYDMHKNIQDLRTVKFTTPTLCIHMYIYIFIYLEYWIHNTSRIRCHNSNFDTYQYYLIILY